MVYRRRKLGAVGEWVFIVSQIIFVITMLDKHCQARSDNSPNDLDLSPRDQIQRNTNKPIVKFQSVYNNLTNDIFSAPPIHTRRKVWRRLGSYHRTGNLTTSFVSTNSNVRAGITSSRGNGWTIANSSSSTAHPRVPRIMLELFESSQSEGHVLPFRSDIVRSFLPLGKTRFDHWRCKVILPYRKFHILNICLSV